MSNYPKVISFYTKNSIYEKEAVDLIASCKRFSLDYAIEGVDDFGSWNQNCYFKPKFILEKLLQYKRAILWMDADSVFCAPPILLKSLKGVDFAARRYAYKCRPLPAEYYALTEFLAGTIYLNYNDKVIDFLERWIKRCEKGKKNLADQYYFNAELKKNAAKLKIYELPISYACIFYEDRSKLQEEAVIVHYQASRLKHALGLDAMLQEGVKNLSGFEQKLLRNAGLFDLSLSNNVEETKNLISFLSILRSGERSDAENS